MENELRKIITELLDAVKDTDLLDLVYKMLLDSIQAPSELDFYDIA